MKLFAILGCLPSVKKYPVHRPLVVQCISSPKHVPRTDPSSSYGEIVSPPSLLNGQQCPPWTAGQTVSTPNNYQPFGLQEDLEWAIYVTLNELGGLQRHWESSTGKLKKEDSKSLLDVNRHLEVLKKSKCSDPEVIECKSLIRHEMCDPEPPKAREIVRGKLEAILKKLDFTEEETKDQLEREEGMWLLCTLFPEQHEFEKDTLVQLWIARDFIKNYDYKKLIGDAYFDALVAEGCIECSRTCFPREESKYKVSAAQMMSLAVTGSPLYLRLSTSKLPKENANRELQNLSLMCDDIDQSMFNQIKILKDLRALLLFPPKSTSIVRIPHEIFLNLKHLQVLNLSGLCIVDLPSSIGEAKELRYLDLSFSLIELLPESIGLLKNLQTLKLRGCVRLLRLPEGIVKLTSLLHLDLNVLSQLSFMPKGMKNLISLETLPAFLVDKDYGRRISELSYMNFLKGSLCISQLERVSSGSEAKEAALSGKEYLKRVELRWNAPRLTRSKEQEVEHDVLEQLRPPSSIEDLEISGYGGLKLPNWIGDSKMLHLLVSITLVKCEHTRLLPSLGELPLLQIIHLIDIKRVKKIGSEIRGHANIAFPALKKFTIVGMSYLETWTGVKEGDFPLLYQLIIEHCPKLVALPSLACFHSLNQLEISQCTKLSSWSHTEFPSSLNTLVVENCPSFK